MASVLKLKWLLVPVILVLVVFGLQFAQPSIIGADGFLHGRMALMISQQGFLHSLPQAHFSWFSTRFSDKDFLYHLYLIPFVTMFEYIVGTKLAAGIATAILFCVVWFVLKKQSRVSWIPLTALGLLLSPQFLRDTSEARPLTFAIALTVLGIYALAHEKKRTIFIVTLLYGMTHLSAWLLPVISLLFLLFDWVKGDPPSSRRAGLWGASKGTALACWAGWGASFLLHPNFPVNIWYFYLNGILVPWFALRGGLELGAEFFPLTTSQLTNNFPLVIYANLGAAWIHTVKNFNLSRITIKWLLAFGILLILGLYARRNVTHTYPVFIMLFGLFLSDWWESLKGEQALFRQRVVTMSIIAGVVIVGYSAWQTMVILPGYIVTDAIYAKHYSWVSDILHKNVPIGYRVFHTNWSDSQFLIGLAPQYEYIETLDPIYMYSYDAKLYALYRDISFGKVKDPHAAIKNTFGADYVYAGKNYFNSIIVQMKGDRQFEMVAEDELGAIFRLK